MPDTPHPPVRRARLVALALLPVLFLAGCGLPNNDPQAYDALTEANFMQGCTGEGTGVSGAAEVFCLCAYGFFVENVPINAAAATAAGLPEEPNFTQINTALRGDPNALPEAMRTELTERCGTSAEPTGTGPVGTGPPAPAQAPEPGTDPAEPQAPPAPAGTLPAAPDQAE